MTLKEEAFKRGFMKEAQKIENTNAVRKAEDKVKQMVEEEMSLEPSDIGALLGGSAGAMGGLSGAYHLSKGKIPNRYARALSVLGTGLAGAGGLGYAGQQSGQYIDDNYIDDKEES